MRLAQLLNTIERLAQPPFGVQSAPTAEVRSLAYDSRQVEPGALFIGLQGMKASGSDFASEAIARGAVAVIASQPPPAPVSVPWIVVSDARDAMAVLAAEFYGHPSDVMTVIGITGTNGKTTTAYLMRAVCE